MIGSGVFHMATDWENYAEHMVEVMNQAPVLLTWQPMAITFRALMSAH